MRLCFNLKSLFVNFKHSCYCTYFSLNTCCCEGILEVCNFTSLMWYFFFSLRLQTQSETWFFERGSNTFKVNYAVGKLAHLSFNPLINKFICIGFGFHLQLWNYFCSVFVLPHNSLHEIWFGSYFVKEQTSRQSE